jgi:hypothetical protein
MSATSEKESGTDPTSTANDDSPVSQYVYWGAIIGLMSGLASLFVVSVYYGQVCGLAPAACLVFGCALTVMLSHPAGLIGLGAGALVGAVCGFVSHFVRHRFRAA